MADNNWHTVKLKLVRRQLNVTLHGQKYHTVLPSKKARRLDINDGFVFAGGVPRRTSDVLQGYEPSSNLRGCLRDVFFDKKNILARPTKADGNHRVYGSPKSNCRHVNFVTLSFQHENAFIRLPSPSTGKNHFNVQMWFRTYFENGVLAVKGLYPYRFFGVFLTKGKMFLEARRSGRFGMVIQVRLGKNLNDGEWHYFSAFVNSTNMKLKVDQLERMRENPLLKEFKRVEDIYMIGHPRKEPIPNFFGCIHDLRVDDKDVDLHHIQGFISGTLYDKCNISSHCFPNPCLHCGRCNETRSGTPKFSCNCQRTFYRGPLCEQPIYLRSCQEYKNLGLEDNAYCKVDPDHEGPAGPLKVLCNVTDKNQAVMVINHNKVGPQNVSVATVTHKEVYIHFVTYSDDLDTIKALIAQSDHCRQFISYRCFESKLMLSPTSSVVWMGGSNLVTDHWPGAPAGSQKCACGVNGACADPRLPCNCDIGDKTWREDRGRLHDRPTSLGTFRWK